MQLLTPASRRHETGDTVCSAPPINITSLAYIQQSFRATPDGDRTDLYRNSYRILKKNIQ